MWKLYLNIYVFTQHIYLIIAHLFIILFGAGLPQTSRLVPDRRTWQARRQSHMEAQSTGATAQTTQTIDRHDTVPPAQQPVEEPTGGKSRRGRDASSVRCRQEQSACAVEACRELGRRRGAHGLGHSAVLLSARQRCGAVYPRRFQTESDSGVCPIAHRRADSI